MTTPSSSESTGDGLRVAVTGGAGQFGLLTLKRLAEDPGVTSAVSLDIRLPDWSHPKVEAVKADIRDPGIAEHFASCDAVVHLAFAVHQVRPRELYEAINVGGSKNVFRAAVAAGARQIVYASSIAAYGLVPSHPIPIREDTPRVRQPDFAYARTKYDVEAFLDEFEGEHPEMIVTRLRPVVMVGEHMGSTMGNLLSRRLIPTTSDVPFPIVWNEDVADAVPLALRQRARGAFNLAADDPLPAKELAAAVGMRALRFPRWLGLLGAHLANLGSRFGLSAQVDPAWIRHSTAPMVLASDKARAELRWEPRCDTAVDVMRHFDRVVPRP